MVEARTTLVSDHPKPSHPPLVISNSMDGKGRCLDTIFIERLWRFLKHECVSDRQHNDVRQGP